jgi:DNA polymerase I
MGRGITDAWYTYEGKLLLHLKIDGRVITTDAPFDPYFFVEERFKELLQNRARAYRIPINVESTDYTTLEGRRVVKVSTQQPYYVSFLRDKLHLPSYEADIPYVRRVLIDIDQRTSNVYSKLYYDIEVVQDKIFCIAVYGDGSAEVIKGDEKEIIERFFTLAELYDMVIGYNSDAYDFPVLKKRASVHKIPLPRVRWYDELLNLRWMRQRMLPSWSLSYVAANLLDPPMKRLYVDKPFSQLKEEEIYARCQRDVEITKTIDEYLKLSELDIAKAHISYLFPDEVNLISRCVDTLLLREARKQGIVLPNKPVYTTQKHHSGALVLKPPESLVLYKNVLLLDVVSLYPSIIIRFAISPDNKKTLYPNMLSSLLAERLRYKRLYQETGDTYYDNLQNAFKIILNATYGTFNSVGFRIQRTDLGDEVATRGRQVITTLVETFTTLGYNVVYGDTDSIFIENVPQDEQCFAMLADVASKSIEEKLGVKMSVEAKAFYSELYFPQKSGGSDAPKKRYAGRVVWKHGWLPKPTLEIVGLEAVRSDAPEVAKNLQRGLIEAFLSNTDRLELQRIVATFKKLLKEGVFKPHELAFSRTVTKGVERYKTIPPHIRAVKKLDSVAIGDKILYLYTKWGPLPLEVVEKENVKIAYDHYWNNLFLPIITRTIGLDENPKLSYYNSFK